MSDPAHVRSVLKAISGNEIVDWDASSSGLANEDARALLDELRVIAQIADAHAALPSIAARVLPFRLAMGATWGTLHVRGLIGSGADGDVYRAYDERLQREVALKLIRHNDQRHLTHALEEARLLARVRHPNVVTVHGADVVDGVTGVWMELIPGETLQSLVASGLFNSEDAAMIGAEVCSGLSAIHRAGVIHRDIKAQNVMRELGGRVVVMDFSVSRNEGMHGSGLAGTPLYLAPELFGGTPASVASDLYSVGVLLYYLVTGKYPAFGSTLTDIAAIHEQRRLTPLDDQRADLPAAFTAAIARALAPDPKQRFSSAIEFEDALRTAIDPTRSIPGSPLRRRSYWAAAIIATLLAVAWGLRGTTPSPSTTSAPQLAVAQPGLTPADTTVTTRSIRARRLYSSASRMLQGAPPWPNAQAERLLREAIQFDPEFASAHILLAHTLANQRRPIEQFMAEAAKARAISAAASEAEREFIEGSYYQLLAQTQVSETDWRRSLEQAALHYERVIVLDRDHPWAAINLVNVLTALRRTADVLRVRVEHAQQQPESAIAQNWPALELYAAGEFERAAPYMAKARLLIQRTQDPEDGFHATWLSLAEAHRLWLSDSPEQSLAIVSAATPHSTEPTVMEVYRLQVMAAYLTLGRLSDAERIAMSATAPAERADLLMETLVMRGDHSRIAQLRDHYLTANDTSRIAWLPVPFDVFEPQLRRLQKSRSSTGFAFLATSLLVDGRMALADGRIDDAITLLQSAIVRRPERGIGRLMSVSMALADAFVANNDIGRAIDALESATQQRATTSYGASQGATWLMARAKLADLYRRAERPADAAKVEEHLRRLLIIADEDHPLKVKLVGRGVATDSPRSARLPRRQP